MSIHIGRHLSHVLSVAAAALFIHIGSVAAAIRQGDIQQQMREVLTGSIATHAISHSESDTANEAHSSVDTQALVRRLLLGWNAFHVGRAKVTTQEWQAQSADPSQKSQADEDFQWKVQRVLLGESASLRGAL